MAEGLGNEVVPEQEGGESPGFGPPRGVQQRLSRSDTLSEHAETKRAETGHDPCPPLGGEVRHEESNEGMRKGLCMVYAREGRSGWKPLRLPRQGGLFRDHRVLKRQVRNNLLSTAHEIGSPPSVKPGRPSGFD